MTGSRAGPSFETSEMARRERCGEGRATWRGESDVARGERCGEGRATLTVAIYATIMVTGGDMRSTLSRMAEIVVIVITVSAAFIHRIMIISDG
jgi:hypothetical protein